MIYVFDKGEVSLFDPENNGCDVGAFAEHWPNAIYFIAGPIS